MIRIFTAFPIRNELATSLLQLSKKNAHIKNIRWTPAENLHMTLFFIGEIEEENLGAIKQSLQKVFDGQKSFSLSFESIIFAGRKKKSSMIWARFKKDEAFTILSEKIYKQAEEFMTVDPVQHDPIPHCTLARIKPSADISSVDKTIDLPETILKVNTAELWQTIQAKEGVHYKSLQRFDFV